MSFFPPLNWSGGRGTMLLWTAFPTLRFLLGTHSSQQFPAAVLCQIRFLTLKLPRLHNPRELHIQHMSLPSPEGGQPDMFDRLS